MKDWAAMSDREKLEGPAWGYVRDGVFHPLPKTPLVLGGYPRPPFDVTLSSGEVRHVISDPTADA